MPKKKNKQRVSSPPKKKQSRVSASQPRYLFLGLGILSIGVAGFIGYRYLKNKNQNSIQVDLNQTSTKVNSSSKKSVRKWKDDSFPLSFVVSSNTGSSGPRVVQLQQKLNTKHNSGLVADGKFGPLTREALLSNGYPASLDLDSFNRIVDSEPTLVFDPRRIAADLWKYANAGNLNSTLATLAQMKDTADYKSVSTTFKTFWDTSDGLKSHTIVTHLLDFAFKNNDSAKVLIRKEFLRMGLTEKGGQWSLSGFRKTTKLITLKDTYVRDQVGNLAQVKKNTILGLEQYSTQGLTWFKAIDGSLAAVPSSDVKYTR